MGFYICTAGFLNENVETLIERNCYLQAFEMTNYVFKIIGNIDIDDSDGGTSYVADICYEKWKKYWKTVMMKKK